MEAVLFHVEFRCPEARRDEIETGHSLAAAVGVERAAVKFVRAALGYPVDEHPGKVALSHVAGSEHHGEFLDRIGRYDLATRRAAGHPTAAAQIEALALIGAVDRDGVVAVVSPRAARRTTRGIDDLRRKLELV